MVGGEGLDRVAPVRDDHEHPLHPLGVLLECLHVREWFRLGREARVGLTVGTAHGPAFARLAGVEEGSCGLGDGLGGGRHDLTPSPSCRLKTPGCGARRLGRCTRSPRSVSRLYAPNSHLQRFAAPIEHGTARPDRRAMIRRGRMKLRRAGLPGTPVWLMASTRPAPSWQPPVAGCCQDLPGRSGDEPLFTWRLSGWAWPCWPR